MAASEATVIHAQMNRVGLEGGEIRMMTVNFRRWRRIWEFLALFGNPFGGYYLQYVPASKPFNHAWSEVLETTTM
jgi:hypothetical protein